MDKHTIGKQFSRNSDRPVNPHKENIQQSTKTIFHGEVRKSEPELPEKSKSTFSQESSVSSVSTVTDSKADSHKALEVGDNRSVATSEKCPTEIRIDFGNLSEKNQQIVSSNLRHLHVLLWTLLFGNGTSLLSYVSILKQLLWADVDMFSMDSIFPYLLPAVLVTVILSIVLIAVTYLRVRNFRSIRRLKIYRTCCALNVFHYAAIFVGIGVKLYLSLSNLESVMKKDLEMSNSTYTHTARLIATQMTRHCCGIHNATDWVDDQLFKQDQALSSFVPLYPDSCCPKGHVDEENESAACNLDRIWKTGCYDLEYDWICFYVGWYLGVLVVGLVLSSAMGLQVKRLSEYIKRYRPK